MPGSDAVILRSVFDYGSYPGGQQEAQAAYDEAVNAVFTLQVDCHRHAQPHLSKKDGRTKWAMIEMWPMQVSLPSISISDHALPAQKEVWLWPCGSPHALRGEVQNNTQQVVIGM